MLFYDYCGFIRIDQIGQYDAFVDMEVYQVIKSWIKKWIENT
jgi:hypothetical protein